MYLPKRHKRLKVFGVDVWADIRDIVYDVSEFKVTPGHIFQTIFDFASILPIVGSFKYSDEAWEVLKTGVKNVDETIDAIKAAVKHADETADAVKAAGKHVDKVEDAINGVTIERKLLSDEIKFESPTKSYGKVQNQIKNRGWTQESIKNTVDNPFQTRNAINRATGNGATAYYDIDGDYVIIDNVTKEIVQISDKFDPEWKPDISIIDPYIKN